MEQEGHLLEIPLQQNSNYQQQQQPSQNVIQQNHLHLGTTDMMIEDLDSENVSNISQLLKTCQFKKALSLLEAEFDSKRASLGELNLQLVSLLNQMSEAWIALAEYSKALDLCEKCTKILQSSQEVPDYHLLMAQTFQNMALISKENQDYKKALDLINKSLELSPAESLENAEKYRIKSLILCFLKQYKEALQEIQRSLDIIDKLTNTNESIFKARAYNAFGEIYTTLHDAHGANKAYETVVEICQKNNLNSHLEMAKAYEELGYSLLGTKKPVVSVVSLAESALQIYDDCFDEDRHPARIWSFLLLARYFTRQKSSSRSKEYIMKALEEGEAFYGSDCEKIREVRICAAKATGNRRLKEFLLAPILETLTEDKNGRELLNLYLHKLDACLSWKADEEFKEIYSEAAKTIKKMYGAVSLEMVEIYKKVIIFYQENNHLKKMVEYIGKYIEIYKEILGDDHIVIAEEYLTISAVHIGRKKFSEAIPYIEQALSIQVQFYGEAHTEVIKTKVLLATAYESNKEHQRSIKAYTKILRIQEEIGDEMVYETYENIGMIYSTIHDAESAAIYFRKAYQMARIKLGMNDERTLDMKEWNQFNAEDKALLGNTQKVMEYC